MPKTHKIPFPNLLPVVVALLVEPRAHAVRERGVAGGHVQVFALTCLAISLRPSINVLQNGGRKKKEEKEDMGEGKGIKRTLHARVLKVLAVREKLRVGLRFGGEPGVPGERLYVFLRAGVVVRG